MTVPPPVAVSAQFHDRWEVRFGLLALIWGASFLLIKVSERSLAPLQVSCGRMVIGTTTLLLIAALRHERLPSSMRTWGHLVVAGLLLNAAPFSLIAYGEQHTSSVAAGIWNATTPLFTLPVAILMIAEERATVQRAAGLAVGFVGVLTVLAIWRGLGVTSLQGNVLCMFSAVSYGFGFPYARKYLAGCVEGPLSLAAGQLICGTLELAIVTPLLTSSSTEPSIAAVASLLVLGSFGTGIAYVLNYSVIRDAGATVASTVTYIIPIFSTLAGLILLGEPIDWNQPIGAATITFGAAIAQGRLRRVGTVQ